MGAPTYNSMKSYYKSKDLPFSTIYVADRQNNKYDGAITVENIDEFMSNFDDTVYVIGGATIFKLALPYADELYITHIDAEHEGDVYMGRFDLGGEFDLASSIEFEIFKFNKYVRKNKKENKSNDTIKV